jgi:hypothetical protein
LLRRPAAADNAAMEDEPNSATPPKRKRRWYQFSLRTLLVVTAIVAVACGWLGSKIEQRRRQRDALATLAKLGDNALAAYDFQLNGSTEGPRGPAWLRSLLGENFFSEVVGAQVQLVQDAERADAGLACIGEFRKLETLTLLGTRVSERGAANLSRLTSLRLLGLGKTGLTDNLAACLRDMTKLEELDLWRTNVSDAGLLNLKDMHELNELSLNGTNVDDAGMECLANLRQLKVLRLSGTKVTNAGLQHLKGLTGLVHLELVDTNVTEAGIADLQKTLPNCKIFRRLNGQPSTGEP